MTEALEKEALVCRNIVVERVDGDRNAYPVLDRIDAAFKPGCPAMISGATGAGKTTLLHVLAGLLTPTSGEVLAGGRAVSRWTRRHRDHWRRGVGIVFQQLHLISGRSVFENVAAPLIPHGLPWRQAARRVDRLVEQLGLAALREQPVSLLSGGQRQRVAIARAMAVDFQYLLLDEPTAFQDDDHVDALCLLWAQAAERGCCMVVCSHDPRLRGRSFFKDRYELVSGHLEPAP